jgi:hypothetical protein
MTTKGATSTGSRNRWQRARCIVLDFIERAGWTAGQQFFAVLLAGRAVGSAIDLPWELAIVAALVAGLASIATTLLQYLTKLTDLEFWPDLGVRLLKTFIASLAGSWAAAGALGAPAFDWSSSFDLAVLATLGALGKGLLARHPGTGENPSTLPPTTYRLAIER